MLSMRLRLSVNTVVANVALAKVIKEMRHLHTFRRPTFRSVKEFKVAPERNFRVSWPWLGYEVTIDVSMCASGFLYRTTELENVDLDTCTYKHNVRMEWR